MHKVAKNAIHDLTLKLRKTLEAEVERELGRYGIYPEREWIDPGELLRLSQEERDVHRPRIEAAIGREQEAGLNREDAVRAFIRETAYTHMNRLLGLKCMEVRGLIKETITTRDIYSGRSKRHRDYLDEHPRAMREPDRGLVAMLQEAYEEVSRTIGVLFDPDSDYSLVWPRHTVLADCIQWINDVDSRVIQKLEIEPEDVASVYVDDTVLGWVYQYFQEEEKARVFKQASSKKISGYDIVPATSLYTERYMVQFLVENSLGALWMEMYPESDLHEGWKYFVEDPNLQNEDGTRQQGRDPKPVSEITLLDLACGSGHFLLYAFDLLAEMYEAEAENQEQWMDKAQIARNILRHNLYGIDIDLRSIQLSALNLYMKACEYAGLPLAELRNSRRIRVNLVCADIVLKEGPELENLLNRFNESENRELVQAWIHGLHNASELGSLLKIEEPVDDLLARKRERERGSLYERPETMWQQWKADFLEALKAFARQGAESFDVNQRILGQEAIRGIELLDLLSKKYAVVATNPPYMRSRNMGQVIKRYLANSYEDTKGDLYASFINRAIELANSTGYIAMITQQTFLFLSSYESFRKSFNRSVTIRSLAHLGTRAFEEISGEKVDTVMFSGRRENPENKAGVYIRATDSDDKVRILREAVRYDRDNPSVYIQRQKAFRAVDGWPTVYWANPEVLELFNKLPRLSDFADPKAGMQTGENAAFLRNHWEVVSTRIGIDRTWTPYMKGGGCTKWYGALGVVIRYDEDELAKRSGSYIRNPQYFFREGVTFTGFSSQGFCARYLPPGFIIDMKGNSVFSDKLSPFLVLGFLSSRLAGYILDFLNPSLSYQVGDVASLPFRIPETSVRERIISLAKQNVSAKKKLLSYEITEPDFERTAVEAYADTGMTLQDIVEHWLKEAESLQLTILGNEALNEHLHFEVYGLSEKAIINIFEDQGLPTGYHPIIADEQVLPAELSADAEALLEQREHIVLTENEHRAVRDQLQKLYSDNPNLEEISAKLEINPISIAALRQEMGLMNEAILTHAVESFLTAVAWGLCKYDEDGIIPYDSGLENRSLLEQVRKELDAVFGGERVVDIEAEMDEILGRGGLTGWLENPFFKKHSSQFNKRLK